MIPFVLQTTAQKKNARIAKFLTLQKQAKTVWRQTTEKITYVFGGKMTNTSTKQNKNLWDWGRTFSCPLTRAITMEVSKGKCWRHARLNVTWHRLCSGSNQEITSSASLVARAAYETKWMFIFTCLCCVKEFRSDRLIGTCRLRTLFINNFCGIRG